MEGIVRLYADASKGGKKQWSIWIEDGDSVVVEWGIVGGKLQTSTDVAKPKGKPGTKSYKNSVTVAHESAERLIRKKREEGYLADGETAAVADYLTALDKNFVPAKPIADYTQEDHQALVDADKIYIQRKRDGRRHLALKTRDGEWKIYSRRMEDLTGHLAHIVDGLSELDIPNGTILDGEVLVVTDGRDDYKVTGRFTNSASNPDEAAVLARQLNAKFMVFDVLFFNTEEVWKLSYQQRYQILIGQGFWSLDSEGTIFLSHNLTDSFADLQDKARRENWEGLILWQKDMPTFVRIGGKPKRIGCAKWKPVKEGDFVASSYFLGSGELSNVVGGLFLSEIAPVTEKIRDCGKVGTGFDNALRKEMLSWSYPCVVEIKYDQQENTGKLRFPVFLRKRDDKGIDECIGKELDTDE